MAGTSKPTSHHVQLVPPSPTPYARLYHLYALDTIPIYRLLVKEQFEIRASNCHSFADPYVEHDELTLLIDLLLLKRAVYRHLLYNRGSEPNRGENTTATTKESDEGKNSTKESLDERELSRWKLVLRLGVILIFVDAFIRWSHLHSNQSPSVSTWSFINFSRIFAGSLAETIAFHMGVILACHLVLRAMSLLQPGQLKSDIRQEFRFSLIPLALFYSSFTKLFFLFLLTIWRPSNVSGSREQLHHQMIPLPFDWDVLGALDFMRDDKLDREWIVRNVMGGMSAGFGLRVILDIHPVFTTFIILIGWATKTATSQLISSWVGGDIATPEAWLAYSIP